MFESSYTITVSKETFEICIDGHCFVSTTGILYTWQYRARSPIRLHKPFSL